MNPQANGQPKSYRLTHLGPVKKALAEQFAHAKIKGKGAAFIAAFEHVYNRLRSTSELRCAEVSASRLKLVVYFGIHLPIVVEFAIHETEPLVVIRTLKFLEGAQ